MDFYGQRYTVSDHGIIVFHTSPQYKDTNLSAFPTEKPIMQHRIRAMPYCHLFRFMHAVRIVNKQRMKILDIGAGDCLAGRFLFQNLKKPRYIAIDLDYERLKTGLERGFGYEEFIFMQHDFTRKLPFEDEQFELVICYEALEHVNQAAGKALIWEMTRILERGGLLSIATPNNFTGRKVADKYKHLKVHGKKNQYEEHPFEWDYNSLRGFLQKTGLNIRKAYGLDCDHIKELDEWYGRDMHADSVVNRYLYEALRDYLPSAIVRLITSLNRPEESSFILIDAVRE